MSPPFHSFHLHKLCYAFMILLPGVTILTATAIRTNNGGNETDRLALLAFKEKITNDPQGVLRLWNDSLNFCDWNGVQYGRRHRRVTTIDLESRGIASTLSPYLGNLSFLRVFNLSNIFQGEIPLELGRLFRLEILDLNGNNFEGKIPSTLSRYSELTFLSVANNNLVEKIPDELSSLSKLTNFQIHVNKFTGGIPSFIGNLTLLETMSAAYNHLVGSIPDAFGQLRNIMAIGLGGNNLSARHRYDASSSSTPAAGS
ncbi:unnamed protein product [Ilex paraguariensis]|uniref:Leucine-rich repeat-containing N-terminal plant-type domain-containing protein n=1 Tax=Ilex paraguariensis TaxID=185542 RepID=A0ABC8TVP6_9AQUA